VSAAPAFDLQSHSVHSDGELAAAQVVENAAAGGVRLLALSDHDTVDGVDEALAAGALHGVRVVPATEISAVDGPYEDLHVLGYGIDHRSSLLNERLLDARGDRERRADAMAARLRELGFEVDPAPVEARKAAGKPVGRPHLAAAVLAHPANADRLAEEGHSDVSSFIPAYLIQGKPGYVARTHPTVEEAIGWIHDAAGVAIWAHPFWDVSVDDEVLAAIDRYRTAGLDGVEAFYFSHAREQTELLADRCEELGLLATGSSDYHGPGHRLFSRFRAFDLHGRDPNLGPIAHGTLAAPARGGDGLCVWLTGLSGSGKSTVGRLAAGQLRDGGHRVEVLDGDDVRQNLCAGLGFSREDRDVNVRRIAWVADLLARNGVVTFVAAVSPYRQPRDEARARMGERFVEVHVKASVEECERRDVKGLYEKARSGQIDGFTGVSDPYEEPVAPELVLDTERETPAESAARLIALVGERLGGAQRLNSASSGTARPGSMGDSSVSPGPNSRATSKVGAPGSERR
jgi:3',5'-nucleoside bisphosphate phosphatase